VTGAHQSLLIAEMLGRLFDQFRQSGGHGLAAGASHHGRMQFVS
jgi:hypothetical protein